VPPAGPISVRSCGRSSRETDLAGLLVRLYSPNGAIDGSTSKACGRPVIGLSRWRKIANFMSRTGKIGRRRRRLRPERLTGFSSCVRSGDNSLLPPSHRNGWRCGSCDQDSAVLSMLSTHIPTRGGRSSCFPLATGEHRQAHMKRMGDVRAGTSQLFTKQDMYEGIVVESGPVN